MTYAEQLQSIVEQYRQAQRPWPATTRDIAAWAVENDMWKPHRSAVISQCAEHLSRAMRGEYITDQQGRTVRAKHAARVKRDGRQLVLWADIQTASRLHMEVAFQQRRRQIVGDCRQLKLDVDSYNQNSADGPPIQMIFDFREDLAELESMEELSA